MLLVFVSVVAAVVDGDDAVDDDGVIVDGVVDDDRAVVDGVVGGDGVADIPVAVVACCCC